MDPASNGSVPADDELLKNEDPFTEIEEGKAKILFPKQNTVFYNNVQVFNRDLSISVIKYFIKLFQNNKKRPASIQDYEAIKYMSTVKVNTQDNGDKTDRKQNNRDNYEKNEGDSKERNSDNINILEALSATGLRAIRYALEIPSVNSIIANDLSKTAVTNIERNIKHNNIEHIVHSCNADASMLLYQHRFPEKERFQIIDLDPYGSPCQFLDGALQAVDDGGLLCITCTDMGALCGNHGEAAFAKYGGLPLKAKYCHEMALRIVLACLDSHAGRYKRYIEPLLSLSADFYIRLFVRVFTSASEVKRSASKKSYIFHCKGCQTFTLQPVGFNVEDGPSKKYKPGNGPVVGKKCEECGFGFKIGGPIWSQPIHNLSFVDGLLATIQGDGKDCYKTYERMIGVLTLMSEELSDQPLYLVLDNLCNIIHCPTPSQSEFRSALLHAGYKVSSTHANESGFKTDAPNSVVWDILRCWVRKNPVKARENSEHSPMYSLLLKEPKLIANFDILPEATPQSKLMKLSRFPGNPEVDWGPKSKATQGNRFIDLAHKRKELQGKRQHQSKKQDLKQFACKRFKRGECNFGADCKFSHEIVATTTSKNCNEVKSTSSNDTVKHMDTNEEMNDSNELINENVTKNDDVCPT